MALEEARGRLRSLQEDFMYNLQVLEERDRELERYDAAFARARGLEEAWQAEELLQEFESEMQTRERSFRLQADSMSHAALTHALQVKLLNKELEALREAGAQSAESLQSTQTVNLELEERLQRGAQELRDLAAVKDARIKDLEGRLHSVQLTRQKEKETFRRK